MIANFLLKIQIPLDYIGRLELTIRSNRGFATGKQTIPVAFPARNGVAEEVAVSRNRFAKRKSMKWIDSGERSPLHEIWNLPWSWEEGRERGREG